MNKYLKYVFILSLIFTYPSCQKQKTLNPEPSPITISLARPNFITVLNNNHPGNRIGYRLHEHEPITYGQIPSTLQEANIDTLQINTILGKLKNDTTCFIYKLQVEKDEHWTKQTWTYYLKPVNDGIELYWLIQTYDKGLPEYHGVQQCFRLGGPSNKEWRREIANTPAFSEYELWKTDSTRSLSFVIRHDQCQQLPASSHTVGARTPLGIRIDNLRTNNNPMKYVGPYKAEMLAPIDNGLIFRSDTTNTWVCGIYWQNTSHVTNHHPADCLHTIVNIGNIPPISKRLLKGKIFWYKGDRSTLANISDNLH